MIGQSPGSKKQRKGFVIFMDEEPLMQATDIE